MRYREGDFEQAEAVQDEWTSRPLTMVLMDIGSADAGNRERLVNMLPRNIQKEERVNIVEREILEKLLLELDLATSDLANPLTDSNDIVGAIQWWQCMGVIRELPYLI